MRKQLAVLAVLAIVAALAAASTAAAQSASLPDIEDEVMCPTCGVPLSHAFSPQAERQRDFIRAADRARPLQGTRSRTPWSPSSAPRCWPSPTRASVASTLVAYVVPVAAVGSERSPCGWPCRARVAGAGPRPEPAAELSQAESARLERDLSRYEL